MGRNVVGKLAFTIFNCVFLMAHRDQLTSPEADDVLAHLLVPLLNVSAGERNQSLAPQNLFRARASPSRRNDAGRFSRSD